MGVTNHQEGGDGLFGFANHWITDGRRDFASTTTMQAQKYAVEVDSAHAGEAVRALAG